jgi:hypothetical protein
VGKKPEKGQIAKKLDGVILVPEVTQRRIDNSDQFVILATVRVAFVPVCL